jgi:nicotinamide-nucleotide amidase
MTAEIVSVGTELLLGQIVDTDAVHLAAVLPEYGVVCHRRQTVGDNRERLAEALRLALSRADLVFTIGGLGPTEDDLTREAIADALEEGMEEDPRIAERLLKFFAMRNLPWTESQLRQAQRPASSEPIENPNGTAPGLICRKQAKFVVALPGPKGEFVPMVEGPVRKLLASLQTNQVIRSRILKTCGIGESWVEERVRQWMQADNPTVAPYAHPGEVHLRVSARAKDDEEAERLLKPVEAALRAELGEAVYGVDDDTLEGVLIRELCHRGEKLAVAESCTGGGLGERLTRVPGCSGTFLGGIISYSNEVKARQLGVSGKTLREHGAVSEPCAREMAEGARRSLAADWGVSITGIAGPDGGLEHKPVGQVIIGVAGPKGTAVSEHRFRGSREQIRLRSVQWALIELRNALGK